MFHLSGALPRRFDFHTPQNSQIDPLLPQVLRAMSTTNGLKDTHKFLDVRNLVGWCCRNSKFGNVGKPPPPFNINTNAGQCALCSLIWILVKLGLFLRLSKSPF